MPGSAQTLDTWRRLRYSPQEILPKPYVLALLYMLHVEHFTPDSSLEELKMDSSLLQLLLSFDCWVPCPCKRCGLTWNFASASWGMYKGEPPKKARKCLLFGASRCLLFGRYLEKENHRLDPPGSTFMSKRSPKVRRDSDKMKDDCYREWLALGNPVVRNGPC